MHDGATVDAATIRESVQQLLTEPGFAEAAATLRAEMADRPSPAQLVTELEKLSCQGEAPPGDHSRRQPGRVCTSTLSSPRSASICR